MAEERKPRVKTAQKWIQLFFIFRKKLWTVISVSLPGHPRLIPLLRIELQFDIFLKSIKPLDKMLPLLRRSRHATDVSVNTTPFIKNGPYIREPEGTLLSPLHLRQSYAVRFTMSILPTMATSPTSFHIEGNLRHLRRPFPPPWRDEPVIYFHRVAPLFNQSFRHIAPEVARTTTSTNLASQKLSTVIHHSAPSRALLAGEQ